MSQARTPARAAPMLLVHLAALLALMWPALVNRQPFFFPDTTSYVRAADLAVQLASGHRITTAWSRAEPIGAAPPRSPAPQQQDASAPPRLPRANENGNVMSGRSPYFGALLYLAYVVSNLWLFVVAQAIVAYALLGLALRRFGLPGVWRHAGVAVLLAVVTPLAYYDSLLLADALAGFGLLAFFLLAGQGRALSRGERFFLIAVVLVSVVSHLTHIVMLLGMTALLGLLAAGRVLPWRRMQSAILIGAIGVAVGLGSVMVTNVVIRHALGRPPVLVPLITARFVADGPGRDFIAAGCGGRQFAACRLPFGGTGSTDYLWSRDPQRGVYLFADPETRRRMSLEDTAFGLAVLRAYPLRQGGMIVRNTLAQIAGFDAGIMNEECLAAPACSGDAVPPALRRQLRDSPSGQGRWPVAALTRLHYAFVVAAVLGLLFMVPWLRRVDPAAGGEALLWIGLLAVAMLINGFLGGAISEPQGRYQARVVWLVPLVAALAGSRLWQVAARGAPALPIGRQPLTEAPR